MARKFTHLLTVFLMMSALSTEKSALAQQASPSAAPNPSSSPASGPASSSAAGAAPGARPILKAPSCESIREEIIPLIPPNFEGTAVWKKVMGAEGMDRPRNIMAIADGGVVMVGESQPYDPQKGSLAKMAYLVRFDKAGTPKIERRYPLKNLEDVVTGGVLKDRIVVLSHVKPSDKDDAVQLDFVDGAGNLQSTKLISDPARRLLPKAMVVEGGASSLMIAVTAVSRQNDDDKYSMLIRVNDKGDEIWRKEYLPGVPNQIEGLTRAPGGQIVALGRVQSEKGRDSGWILRVSRQGDIMMQRPYPRGAEALLRGGFAIPDGSVIAVGDSIPARDGARAAWVMKIDPAGEIIWQKYITGKYSYAGMDAVGFPDGRMNILISGRPSGFGGRQHARILTLTTAGQMIGDESYIDANNLLPEKLMVYDGNRYLAGMSETGFSKYADKKVTDPLQTYDALVSKIPPMADYTDSCAKGNREKLDDLP